MIDATVAQMMGIGRADADNLLNGGFAAESIAEALGLALVHVQPYLDNGSVAPVFAERLGLEPEVFEDFSTRLTKKGRVGLIFGLLLPR